MRETITQKEHLRRLVLAGMLTAAAMILSWIEAILPFSIGIPGVKLGLCHIMTLIALYCLSPWETVALTAIRLALSALLFGSVASLAYSAAGGFFSLAVMFLLMRARKREKPFFSPLGVSMVGGVCHNLGQLVTAACLMQTPGVMTYLPVLLAAGVVTGGVIGVVAGLTLRKLPLKIIKNK